MEPNNCPKPDCGRPESTHRYSAGKKLSICGNGHSWDAQVIADQRAKARGAEDHEFKIEFAPGSVVQERMKREMERLRKHFDDLT